MFTFSYQTAEFECATNVIKKNSFDNFYYSLLCTTTTHCSPPFSEKTPPRINFYENEKTTTMNIHVYIVQFIQRLFTFFFFTWHFFLSLHWSVIFFKWIVSVCEVNCEKNGKFILENMFRCMYHINWKIDRGREREKRERGGEEWWRCHFIAVVTIHKSVLILKHTHTHRNTYTSNNQITSTLWLKCVVYNFKYDSLNRFHLNYFFQHLIQLYSIVVYLIGNCISKLFHLKWTTQQTEPHKRGHKFLFQQKGRKHNAFALHRIDLEIFEQKIIFIIPNIQKLTYMNLQTHITF